MTKHEEDARKSQLKFIAMQAIGSDLMGLTKTAKGLVAHIADVTERLGYDLDVTTNSQLILDDVGEDDIVEIVTDAKYLAEIGETLADWLKKAKQDLVT